MKKIFKKFIQAFAVFTIVPAHVFASDLYSFKVKKSDQTEISMSDYKNKTLLIVNTASKCGYTSQYEGLEALYAKYEKQGFVILGFPSNQFLGQEPGTNEEIQKFCKLKYGVNFPVFSKIDVKGDTAIPLYKWLTSQKKSTGKISWNFNKFLINKNGDVVKHFGSSDKPAELEPDIKKLIEIKETK